ncbi:tRNA (cytidine(56)-2'-O)-methyltransferase [Candidatus Aenigmatarchaeota archaeon]
MIIVLRLGHRLKRDERISTHCGLVSRALGAKKIVYTGEKDEKMIKNLKKISKNWGGSFAASHIKDWKKFIKQNKKFTVVHLTMYGIPFEKEITKIKKKRNLIIIIGSEKVPREVYDLADYNIAVTNQPHSEVAALAIFLHSIGRKAKHTKAKYKIVPHPKGKNVVKN